jgi:hypothetical protein
MEVPEEFDSVVAKFVEKQTAGTGQSPPVARFATNTLPSRTLPTSHVQRIN